MNKKKMDKIITTVGMTMIFMFLCICGCISDNKIDESKLIGRWKYTGVFPSTANNWNYSQDNWIEFKNDRTWNYQTYVPDEEGNSTIIKTGNGTWKIESIEIEEYDIVGDRIYGFKGVVDFIVLDKKDYFKHRYLKYSFETDDKLQFTDYSKLDWTENEWSGGNTFYLEKVK